MTTVGTPCTQPGCGGTIDRVLAREPAGADQLPGCDLTERALRFGLERSYRTQAQLSSGRRRRTMLVDMANQIRPDTWS